MGKNIPGLKRGFHYDPKTQGLGIYVDGVQVADYTATQGRTYYVNNITGSSGGDGLSWGSAMNQVSVAITASEVYRALGYGAPTVSTNDYVRNTIVVQATGTAYTPCDALPSHCDIIGLGATPRGNGPGIVRIDGAGSADAMEGSAKGLGLYNLQMLQSSAASFWGLKVASLLSSRIEGCGFVNCGSGGIHITVGGGIVMNDVHCGHDTYAQAYGLRVQGGAAFNSCIITNCDFWGDSAGVWVSNSGGKETIFKDCFAGGGTLGFQDTSPSNMPLMVHYIRCYGKGTANTTINTAGFKLTNEWQERSIGCIDNANGTLFRYPSMTD